MHKKFQVGCPCCCSCWDDKTFTNWAADVGSWTGTTTRATTSADAILSSDRRASFQVLSASCEFTSHQATDAVRFGFRNAAGDQVYVEAVVQANTNYVTWTGYKQPAGESRTSIWTGPTSFTRGTAAIRILLDDDNDRFTVFLIKGTTGADQFGVCAKLTTDLVFDTAFAGTGVCDSGTTATFTLGDHYNCLCHYCMGIGASEGETGGINFAPSEFELGIAGVTGSESTYINVSSVDVYEPRAAVFGGGVTGPFAGGTFPDWKCYWGWRNPTLNPPTQYGNAVEISYNAGDNETTVAVKSNSRSTVGDPVFSLRLQWHRVFSGKLDARTVDITLDSDDLTYDPGNIAGSATVTLVASS